MSKDDRPGVAPAPAIKTEDVPKPIPAPVPAPIPIPMEYEPVRYGNTLNAKAVLSAQHTYPEISFEEGESALETLGLRYRTIRGRVSTDNMEFHSREWYGSFCETNLVRARDLYDKAATALYQAHHAMRFVYMFAVEAANAPSVSRIEYHRRRKERDEQALTKCLELRAAQAKEKHELKKKGCKCFDEPEGETAGDKTVGTAAGAEPVGNTATPPPAAGGASIDHVSKGARGEDSSTAGAPKQQGIGNNKRGRGDQGGEVGDESLSKRAKK